MQTNLKKLPIIERALEIFNGTIVKNRLEFPSKRNAQICRDEYLEKGFVVTQIRYDGKKYFFETGE